MLVTEQYVQRVYVAVPCSGRFVCSFQSWGLVSHQGHLDLIRKVQCVEVDHHINVSVKCVNRCSLVMQTGRCAIQVAVSEGGLTASVGPNISLNDTILNMYCTGKLRESSELLFRVPQAFNHKCHLSPSQHNGLSAPLLKTIPFS